LARKASPGPALKPDIEMLLESCNLRTKCAGNLRSNRYILASLVLLAVSAQDTEPSARNEVVGKMTLPPDGEGSQLDEQTLKAIVQQDGDFDQADEIQPLLNEIQPPGVTKNNDEKDSPDHLDSSDEKAVTVTVDDAPLELATEDAAPSARPTKAVAAEASIPQGSMDGEIGIVRTRLASEERFNLRLQKLLSQSALDNHKKQVKLTALQTQLQTVSKQHKDSKGAARFKILAEEKEITMQRSRADGAEKRLRKATKIMGSEGKTISWLRERVKTLMVHLGSVSHIGKALEGQLAEANSNSASKSRALEDMQRKATVEHHEPLQIEPNMHEFLASKTSASEEARTRRLENQNKLLEQRLQSLTKRDSILNDENTLLRGKLHTETAQKQVVVTELSKAKAALSESQKADIQLQGKYADSLKALISAQAANQGEPLDRIKGFTTDSSPAMISPNPLTDEHASTSLLELGRDSSSLTSLMTESHRTKRSTHTTQKLDAHDRDLQDLGHNSNDLVALLKGIAEQHVRMQVWTQDEVQVWYNGISKLVQNCKSETDCHALIESRWDLAQTHFSDNEKPILRKGLDQMKAAITASYRVNQDSE